MATHLFEHRSEPPRSRAAWLASFAVHASMFGALAYLSWTTLGHGLPRRKAPEPAMILGLSDGTAEETGGTTDVDSNGTARADDSERSEERTLDEASSIEGAVSASLAEGDAMIPVATLAEPAAALAPAPRLPLISLTDSHPAGGATSNGPPAPAGRPQLSRLVEQATVTVFGAAAEGSRFVYLFDRSTSMEGAPLAAAKQQLMASLAPLSSVHQFQVIFFNHEVQSWDMTGGQQRVPYASDANKQLAEQFVRKIIAGGGTDRIQPLRQALRFHPDVVFFLTDTDDQMSHFDVADVIERARSSGTEIVSIEFGEGPAPRTGRNFLRELAGGTGGGYVYVDTGTLGR